IRLIGDSDARLPLARIAEAVGYAPHHFHRLFRRATGMTPAAYARNPRADRLARHLREGEGSVTEAIYQAGYEAPSRAYADAARRLGMTPAAWMTGGVGAVIRHVSVAVAGGSLLIAATERGLCHVAAEEDAEALRTLFPGARIVAGDAAFEARVGEAIEAVGALSEMPLAGELPAEMRAEAVSQAIWRALDMALFGER
ncbi:MAG: helix-turn-helix domain-containing protein, partial [Sphingobium sp.]